MMEKTLFEVLNMSNHEELLSELENRESPDLTVVNESGQSPLHLAVLANQVDVAAILLSRGFDPSQKDKNHLSPFIAAAANGFTELFELLLEYQPDVTHFNRFGGTALLPSSEKGFLSIVQLALDAGVPVNHVNKLGWSALLEAIILGNDGFLYRDIVEELMVAGADIDIVDFSGRSAVDYAKQKKSELILTALENKQDESDFIMIKHLIRQGKSTAAIQRLLKLPVSPEQSYYLGVAYENLKNYEAAQYYYEKGRKQTVEFAYYLANLAKKMGDTEKALAYFDKGAQYLESRDFFLYHKSNFLRELGRHEEAVEVMNSLLSEEPDRVDYMFHKANSLRALGKFQEAYETMLLAKRTQPENPLFAQQAKLIEDEM
ncbi:ankyrin repeat domain-containing protein [Lactococcus formosensis]|nr:ankyrin repeat domain-containing protein [Lactococcus formosensis]